VIYSVRAAHEKDIKTDFSPNLQGTDSFHAST